MASGADATVEFQLVARDLASAKVAGLNREIAATGTATRTAKGYFSGFGIDIMTAFDKVSQVFGMVSGMVSGAIQQASNLAESESKVTQVFGEQAEAVHAWAADAAQSFGQSTQQALEAAGTYGNLFQAFGVGQEQAQEMSTSLVELAADMASFNNTSMDDAIQALRSGLSGEPESLKRYGVALNDVRIRQELTAQGMTDLAGTLTPLQKMTGAYALILKDTSIAQGDFERTSTGLANRQRIAAAMQANAMAEIGEALIPLMIQFTELSAKVLPDVISMVKALTGPLLAVADVITGNLVPALLILATGVIIGKVIPAISAYLASLKTAEGQTKLAALSMKAAWGIALIGLPFLLELMGQVGDAATHLGRQFQFGSDTVVKEVEKMDELLGGRGTGMAKWADIMHAAGVSFEELQAIIAEAGGDIDLVTSSFLDAGGDLARATQHIRSVMGTTTSAMTVEWAEAWRAMADEAANGFNAGIGLIEDDAAEGARTVLQTLATARHEAALEAALIPSDIADAILSGKEELNPVKKMIHDIIVGSISNQRTLAQNAALLLIDDVNTGLTSKRTETRNAMIAALEPVLASMVRTNEDVFQKGTKLAPNVAKGIRQTARDIIPAMRLIPGLANASLSELATYAEENGQEGIAALIRGVLSKEPEARGKFRRFAGDRSKDFKMDLYDEGQDAADSWISGIATGIRAGASVIGDALHYAKVNGGFGESLPKKGPFTAAKLDDSARSITGYWNKAMAGGLGGFAVSGGLGAYGAGGGGVVVNINSTFPPTQQQAANIARAMLPELERERRRQFSGVR